jgi:GTP-binding protein YchF
MRVGMAGLPQAGTTTLFNTLTGAHAAVGGYRPGERVQIGMVTVPDGRLDVLAAMLHPKECTPATLEFEDVSGVFGHLVGQEHSGRAVAALRDADAVLLVLRAFESAFVPEVLGRVDPAAEFQAMLQELLLADLQVIENRLQAVGRDLARGGMGHKDELERERDLLDRCRVAIEQGKGLSAIETSPMEHKSLRSYAFLTLKPRLCVLNIGEDQIAGPPVPPGIEPPPIPVCAELEMELMELGEADRTVFMEDAGLDELGATRLIHTCYRGFGLASFFTCVSDKLRAWTVEAGADARTAAGKVHSDMEAGFIRAEVVGFEDLNQCGSIKEARNRGKLRMEGKDYIVQDGDVVTFHFTH